MAQESAPNDAAYAPLTRAFDALRARDYDSAIAQFGMASGLSPGRADIRKNLAYALLKTGETDAAREQFGAAVRLDPADLHVALEYAFLCFEARDNAPARRAEARRIFLRIRDTPGADASVRATAAQAFGNIDPPLEEGIARWQSVLASSTPTFSGHYELAQLAEARDALDLAVVHYAAAFQMLPERKSVLLELARVERARGNREGAMAALLAASRGGEPRAAELAREQLSEQLASRYPYVYEFRQALDLDPKNAALHRELAYLLLSMSEKEPARSEEARLEFQKIAEASPDDYVAQAQLGLLYLSGNQPNLAMPILRSVLARGDPTTANHVRMALKMPLVLESRDSPDTSLDPRILGERSYQAGFLKDAKRYFLLAREMNPVDAAVALKLGWTTNMLHDDPAALRWFDIARHSADPAVSSEAGRAYGNLLPALELFRTTVWAYPMYSSRWSDLFGYGQIKTEVRVKPKLRPYASVRFVGDARRSTGGVSPQSLSESAFIVGAGIATAAWHGASAWFEAGEMFGYLHLTHYQDYRGGLTYSRTFGAALASESGGWFLETTDDSVFVSHFNNDLLTYSQNKAGYSAKLAGVSTQTFWSNNITFDAKHQYWANFAETGPGFRFRFPEMPRSMSVTLNAIRGAYLVNTGNPRGPNFNDFRAGVWYAFTK